MKHLLSACVLLGLFFGCDNEPEPKTLSLLSARVGTIYLTATSPGINAPTNQPVVLSFSASVVPESANAAVTVREDQQNVPVNFSFADQGRTLTIVPANDFAEGKEFTLVVTDQLRGSAGEKFGGVTLSFSTAMGQLKVLKWTIGDQAPATGRMVDAPLNMDLNIQFNRSVRTQSVQASSVSLKGPSASPLVFQWNTEATELTITASNPLVDLAKYTLTISDAIEGAQNETFTGLEIDFYTTIDPDPDFPLISDEALLTLVQEQTFKYFWDFAHPASGMARERNTSGNTVTSGGSGFGIMALIVGMERNFISRQQGLERMNTILNFLETADRFHGVWPHWMNGNTGDVVPFSANDNGGDLVETSFLIQGLLTFRQYLDGNIASEQTVIDRINALWHTVEWDWYTRGGQNVLYWHWSPDKQWTMNHPIRGYNEALITYFLAAGSPDHSIGTAVYHTGWANGGAMVSNKTFYGINLPLGYDYGGPLFFAHYSFLGLDPRNLTDSYGNYWTQNVNHSLINHAYSEDNPKNYVGYSDVNWGLTASDNHQGYSAHSPTNDLGVITPTAALSSFPYTPEESMKALEFFYYTLGDRLWGPYGFYDAFNTTEGWTANSYLAIDQGPIIVMIENHRTGLLWDLFMSSPEVQVAMDKLGFSR